MLKKVGKGTTLEDLKKVKGGLKGNRGTSGCNVCGDCGNDQNLLQSYLEWSRADF